MLLLVASIPLQLLELPYCTVRVPKGGKGAASSLEGGAQSGNDIISTVFYWLKKSRPSPDSWVWRDRPTPRLEE